MRIIELERRTWDGEPIEQDALKNNAEDYRDWWCVIETKEEEMVYEDFVSHLGEYGGDSRDILWNKLVIHAGQGMGVKWGDDDMYGYIHPDEDVPEAGEEMVDSDGDTWVRVA